MSSPTAQAAYLRINLVLGAFCDLGFPAKCGCEASDASVVSRRGRSSAGPAPGDHDSDACQCCDSDRHGNEPERIRVNRDSGIASVASEDASDASVVRVRKPIQAGRKEKEETVTVLLSFSHSVAPHLRLCVN